MNLASEPVHVLGGAGERDEELIQMIHGVGLEKLPRRHVGKSRVKVGVLGHTGW